MLVWVEKFEQIVYFCFHSRLVTSYIYWNRIVSLLKIKVTKTVDDKFKFLLPIALKLREEVGKNYGKNKFFILARVSVLRFIREITRKNTQKMWIQLMEKIESFSHEKCGPESKTQKEKWKQPEHFVKTKFWNFSWICHALFHPIFVSNLNSSLARKKIDDTIASFFSWKFFHVEGKRKYFYDNFSSNFQKQPENCGGI